MGDGRFVIPFVTLLQISSEGVSIVPGNFFWVRRCRCGCNQDVDVDGGVKDGSFWWYKDGKGVTFVFMVDICSCHPQSSLTQIWIWNMWKQGTIYTCLWTLQQVWPVWQQLLCRVLQHLGEHETDSSGFTTRQYSNLPTALHCTASLYHSPNGTLLGRSPKKGCLYQNQRGSSLQCIGMFLWRLSLYLPLLEHK